MDTYETHRINSRLCFPLYLSAKEITRTYNEVLKAYDLTYTQYIVMLYFWEIGSSNLKDLSNALMLDASTLTPMLKKLEAKGFIERNRSAEDERNLLITLTRKGQALKNLASDVPEQVAACTHLSAQEMETLHQLSYRLICGLRK